MRSASEIQGRVRYLLSKELDRRVQLVFQRLPHQCTHNYRHPMDVRKRVDGEPNEDYNRISLPTVQQSLGLCTLGMEDAEQWNGTICEDPIDAQRCPYYTPKVTKEDLRRDFEVQTHDPKWLQENLPEIHGLLWALSQSVSLPWWKRIWFWFLRIRTDPMKQLPEFTDGNPLGL